MRFGQFWFKFVVGEEINQRPCSNSNSSYLHLLVQVEFDELIQIWLTPLYSHKLFLAGEFLLVFVSLSSIVFKSIIWASF